MILFAHIPQTPHLKYHLCTRHAFHHYLGVTGRCLSEYLGAYGGQIQQDRLQGVSIEKELVERFTGDGNSARLNIYAITRHTLHVETDSSKPTCSAPTMLIGLHLKRWLMNLGMKELKKQRRQISQL